MTQYTQEDLIKAKDKAAKALEKMHRIAEEINPNIDWDDHLGMDPFSLAEQLHMPAFLDEFKPKEWTVTVWIARPYIVKVESAMDEEDAVNAVQDNLHSVEFTESPLAYQSGLAENVLDTHPYDMVAEEN
jgi:hypothetical protein